MKYNNDFLGKKYISIVYGLYLKNPLIRDNLVSGKIPRPDLEESQVSDCHPIRISMRKIKFIKKSLLFRIVGGISKEQKINVSNFVKLKITFKEQWRGSSRRSSKIHSLHRSQIFKNLINGSKLILPPLSFTIFIF
jgi:hypothetical protein